MTFLICHAIQYDNEMKRDPANDDYTFEDCDSIENMKVRFPNRICAWPVPDNTLCRDGMRRLIFKPFDTQTEKVMQWWQMDDIASSKLSAQS